MKFINRVNFSSSNKAASSNIILILLAVFGMFSGFTTSASAVELLKFMVNEPGMQRVAYEDIPADFDLRGLNHKKFNVLRDGKPVDIRVVGQSEGNRRF